MGVFFFSLRCLDFFKKRTLKAICLFQFNFPNVFLLFIFVGKVIAMKLHHKTRTWLQYYYSLMTMTNNYKILLFHFTSLWLIDIFWKSNYPSWHMWSIESNLSLTINMGSSVLLLRKMTWHVHPFLVRNNVDYVYESKYVSLT